MINKDDVVIVYILTKLELGGAQKVCLELFNHFSPNSYLMSAPNGVLFNLVSDNPRFIPVNSMRRDISLFGLIDDFKALIFIYFTLLKLKRKHPFLLVHTHSSKAGIIGRIAAFCAGIKNIIHTVHGFAITPNQSFLKKLLFWFLEQLGTLLSSKIVVVSEVDKINGSYWFWGFKKKAILIRAAIDEKPFLKTRPKAHSLRLNNQTFGKVIIGTISCFKPQKNLFDLIKAFYLLSKSLPNPELLFLQIIGDGELRPELEQQIENYNLKSQIILFGWQRDVVSIMKAWDIFALTSLWEGLPCSLVQALILGQIPICYNTGGIGELIENGKSGFLIDQKDVFSFYQKLRILVTAQSREKQFVVNYEKTALFSLDAMFSKHRLIYSQIFI